MMNISIGKYTIEQGLYSENRHLVKDMLSRHWDEVGMPGAEGLELDMDDAAYVTAELYGNHLGFLVKKEGLPIGYFSVIIFKHQQHKDVLYAQNDGLFIDKNHRGFSTYKVVKTLIEEVQKLVKNEHGVSYFVLSENASHSLKFLAEQLGMTKSAVMYTKRL